MGEAVEVAGVDDDIKKRRGDKRDPQPSAKEVGDELH